MISAALTAFNLLGAATRWVIVGLIVTAATTGAGLVYYHIYSNGYDAALADIAKEDSAAIDRATNYRNTWKACKDRGLAWDQSTGKCG